MDTNPSGVAPASTQCQACGNAILLGAKMCANCKFPKGDVKQCVNCGKLMPHDVPFCNECKSYQKLRYFPVSATVIALFAAFIGVISAVIPAVSYFLERNSHTRFKVTSADDLHIYLKAWNTGRQPSTLVGYHLKFQKQLPIENVALQLSTDDVVGARNVIAPGQPVKIGLTMTESESLEIAPTVGEAQNTKDKISKILSSQPVVLEIDVEESDDPRGGVCSYIKPRKFHTRSDTFPVGRIKAFVVSRMSEGQHAQVPPTTP